MYISLDKTIYNFTITLLNTNNFLFLFKSSEFSDTYLFQYEFEENKKILNLKEKKELYKLYEVGYKERVWLQKYFDNKLIIKKKNIEVYG